ncbi:MAG: 3-hydroxyacyl-CoA dehydrogenase [Flammeovirgaceae bacterium]
MQIKRILVLGAGALGSRVALQAAISKFEVNVYDLNENALSKSRQLMEKVYRHLVKQNRANEQDQASVFERLHFTIDAAAAIEDVDLVNESVTEDLNIKLKVWQQFGAIARSKTIFTTNTSYLLPSQLADASGRPEKFCAFHFHDVFHARVVDIMPHTHTDPELIPLLFDLGKVLNQVPVLVRKESPGYIFNFMLMALIGAAGKLKTGEVGSIEDIDRSWMVNFNQPIGPFGILDNIGLDTAWHVTKDRPDAASHAFAALLKSYIDQGKLGEKTGEGFYQYPHPAYKTFVETKQ